MKLLFKNKWRKGYYEKDVDIVLNFGTLEPLCCELGIEFNNMDEFAKSNSFDFMTALLWHGYISACKENYKKPEYTKVQSIIWYAKISKESEAELKQLLTELSGSIVRMAGKKNTSKKKVN